MQSIQDKTRNLLKEAGAHDEEMRKVREEMNAREARHLELANKSNNNRMAAEDLEEELRGLQVEEGRGSCASQSNGCCLDAVVKQLFTGAATHARQQFQALQEDFFKRFKAPTALAQMPGGEERGGEWEEEQPPRAASRQSRMGPPALHDAHARQQIQALQEEFIRRFVTPTAPAHSRRRRKRRRVGRGASAKSSQSPNGSTGTMWAQ